MRKVAGTSYYMAPEVLRGDYSEEADMWSFGVVVFMLLSGRCPFGGKDDEQIQANVLRGKYLFKKGAWEGVSNEAKDFINKLLVQDYKKRMTAKEALQHPWMKGTILGIPFYIDYLTRHHFPFQVNPLVDWSTYCPTKEKIIWYNI